jgi:hypothetical protein
VRVLLWIMGAAVVLQAIAVFGLVVSQVGLVPFLMWAVIMFAGIWAILEPWPNFRGRLRIGGQGVMREQ